MFVLLAAFEQYCVLHRYQNLRTWGSLLSVVCVQTVCFKTRDKNMGLFLSPYKEMRMVSSGNTFKTWNVGVSLNPYM